MLVLYIHGFLSSPQSFKSQQVGQFCQYCPTIQFACPFLPAYPDQAITILEDIVATSVGTTIGLIGSSMGGFYATYLSQRYQLPAVLINPAVKPYDLMENYLGRNLRNYHTNDTYHLGPEHVAQLRALEVNRLQYPRLLWLMAQTGDETLDYRAAVEYYRDCKQTVEEGGDHSFQYFEQHLPDIVEFLLETGD